MAVWGQALLCAAIAGSVLYFALAVTLALRLDRLKQARVRLAPSKKETLFGLGPRILAFLFSNGHRLLGDGVVTGLVYACRALLVALVTGWPLLASLILTRAFEQA